MSEVLKLSSIPIGFSKIEGIQGPRGPAGPTYRLDCNVETITRGLTIPISPKELIFSAYSIDEEGNINQLKLKDSDYQIKLFNCIPDPENANAFETTLVNSNLLSTEEHYVKLITTGIILEEEDESEVTRTALGYAKGEDGFNVSSIKVQLLKGENILVETSVPFVLEANMIDLGQITQGNVYIANGKVLADSIVTDAVTAEKIAAGSIMTNHFAANRIVSSNYIESEERAPFSEEGTLLDLVDGSFHTKNFYVDTKGNAAFSGRIEAQSGSILGTLIVGSGSNITISGDENKPFIQAGSVFSLTQDGLLTTTSASLGGWNVNSENIYKGSNDDGIEIVGLYSGSGNVRENSPIRFYAGSNQDLSKKEFTVTEDGTLYASMAHISGEINATSGSISGELTVGNNGIVINGSESANPPYISSAQYASGAAGWKIDNNGFAEFGDAYIRGTLRSTVFETNTVSAVGGDLYVAPTIKIKQEDLISQNIEGDILTLICSNEALKDTTTEQLIRKQWDNSVVLLGFNAIKNSEEVTFDKVQGTLSFNTDGTELELTMSISENDLSGDLIIKTDLTVIKLGQGTDRHYIHLTANTGNISTPYLDVYSAPMDAQNVLPKVRLGNLSGINDEDNFGGTLSGYGLYSNNAYITGLLALPNAGITNQTKVGYTGEGSYTEIIDKEKAGTAIRYWAGSSMPKVGDTKAPFIVTQDGTLYATKGVFEGKVIASESQFSGTIQAAGIVIDKKDIEGSPPSKGKNHFFVGYSSEPKDYDDYVLDISRYGLRVWEGGFNVYSDTLSGWPMDEEIRDEEKADPLYGYTSKNKNPYPYISAIDAGRMAIRDINIMSPIGDKSFSSIYSTNGALHFGKIKSVQEGENFTSVESSLFNEALSSLQVENNAFTMKTPSAAMRVNEKVSSIEAQSENFIVSNSKAAAKMSFNNEISIEEVKQQIEADGKLVMETIGFNFLI